MNILALDLAIKTGFALLDASGKSPVVTSGVQTFELRRGESSGMRSLRLGRWLEDMRKMVGNEHIDLVAFEKAHHRGGSSTEVALAMRAKVIEKAAEWEVDHTDVHTATLKKFAVKDGRATKEAMIARACELFEREPEDDNEADALLILAWACEDVGASWKPGVVVGKKVAECQLRLPFHAAKTK